MRKKIEKQYILNRETLDYELVEQPSRMRKSIKAVLLYGLSSVSLFVLMLYLMAEVYQVPTPRRMLAGYGGVDRYADIRERDYTGEVTSAVTYTDILLKKAYIQSKSFDQVALVSERAAEMAVCAPTIPPVNYAHVRQASGFGMRVDPILKNRHRKHQGVDLAPKSGKDGEPVYVTGNGVVKSVGYDAGGYGRFVLVDHGFGYQTRYAHLSKALVEPGQEVLRGQQIAEMGNTGRSTGTHLHYEVIYMGKHVNPVNYYNKDILPEDYAAIIDSSNEKPMS